MSSVACVVHQLRAAVAGPSKHAAAGGPQAASAIKPCVETSTARHPSLHGIGPCPCMSLQGSWQASKLEIQPCNVNSSCRPHAIQMAENTLSGCVTRLGRVAAANQTLAVWLLPSKLAGRRPGRPPCTTQTWLPMHAAGLRDATGLMQPLASPRLSTEHHCWASSPCCAAAGDQASWAPPAVCAHMRPAQPLSHWGGHSTAGLVTRAALSAHQPGPCVWRGVWRGTS